MYLSGALVIIGFAMQVAAWNLYKRDYPKFWVSRPIWYFLYPKGVVLFIAGIWLVLGGLVLYATG